MGADDAHQIARAELQAGIDLTKCRQCGCMRETLETLRTSSASSGGTAEHELAEQASAWLALMMPIRYPCLGCEHCFPAVALNALSEAGVVDVAEPACAFEATDRRWPVVAGEYVATCSGAECPVAVSTLASSALADELARRQPPGLCIVGKTETENIGVDKLVKNVVANSTIQYLIVAGREPDGYRSGQTLVALANNGVDDRMRVVGSLGKRPILRNVTPAEVDAFRRQVQLIDLIGCEDAERIIARIGELTAAKSAAASPCDCGGACATKVQQNAWTPEVIQASAADHIEMDFAGYFVIIPDAKRKVIVVEHYAYDNQLQHVVEGSASRDIYGTIIDAGWVSQLSHAAYLGKELAAAELSLRHGFAYIQDAT